MTQHIHFTANEVRKASAASHDFAALIDGKPRASDGGIVFVAEDEDSAKWLAKMRGRALGVDEKYLVIKSACAVETTKAAPAPAAPRREYTERELLEPIARRLGVDLDAPLPTPYEELEKGLQAFCKAEKIDRPWTVGLAKFVATPEGARLHARYEADPTLPPRPAPPAVEKAHTQSSAMAQLESALDAFCVAKGIPTTSKWTRGLSEFEQTAEGAALRAATQEH